MVVFKLWFLHIWSCSPENGTHIGRLSIKALESRSDNILDWDFRRFCCYCCSTSNMREKETEINYSLAWNHGKWIQWWCVPAGTEERPCCDSVFPVVAIRPWHREEVSSKCPFDQHEYKRACFVPECERGLNLASHLRIVLCYGRLTNNCRQ